MKKFRHIVLLAAALVPVLSACSRAKVIPRSDFADIYADMLLADQWLLGRTEMLVVADTTFFYEPILKKHGYDSDDYRRSVDYYMSDPARYSRILQKTSAKLKVLQARTEQKLLAYDAEQARIEWLHSLSAPYENYLIVPRRDPSPDRGVAVSQNENGYYHLYRVESDTTYKGPVIIVRTRDAEAPDSLSEAASPVAGAIVPQKDGSPGEGGSVPGIKERTRRRNFIKKEHIAQEGIQDAPLTDNI